MASSSVACSFFTFWQQISPRPSRRSRAWSPVLNSVLPWKAAIRCPVTTQGDVQFSKVDIVGLGISSPAYLTGRWVNPRSETPIVPP